LSGIDEGIARGQRRGKEDNIGWASAAGTAEAQNTDACHDYADSSQLWPQ
jgi:hypothetical protein